MIRGKVIGKVWSTRHVDSLPSGALLEVDINGDIVIAYDPLGCAIGENVLISQGSVAASFFTKIKAPIDALIIGSIDDN
jgi:ethanolamine utilization protein EutN